MRRTLPTLAVLLLLMTPVAGQDYDKGYEAYMRGDYAAALDELRPLAAQGDIFSQVTLADMHERGVGVPQDYAQAAKWWRIIAQRGNAHGQSKLGLLYRDGRGVAQDPVQAHMWLGLAAAQGYRGARRDRDAVAARMTAGEIAEAQRAARAWRARHLK